MAITSVDVTTAEFDGTDVILEHNDEVTTAGWNSFVENGASTYYQPQVCISYNSTKTLNESGVNYDEFFGCIPPANPAADSGYDERFDCFFKIDVTYVTGNDCIVTVYGGTDVTSLGSLATHTFTRSSGSYYVQVADDVAVPHYNQRYGSADPYYIRVDVSVTAPSPAPTQYKLNRLDVYYRKFIDPTT